MRGCIKKKAISVLMYSTAVVLFFTSGDPIPDWSRGGRDKLRAPLLAALFLFRLIGVWERDLVTVSSPCKYGSVHVQCYT